MDGADGHRQKSSGEGAEDVANLLPTANGDHLAEISQVDLDRAEEVKARANKAFQGERTKRGVRFSVCTVEMSLYPITYKSVRG